MGRSAARSCLIPGCPVLEVVRFERRPTRLGPLGSGQYAKSMAKRRPYPSDLSDVRWELVEPVLAAWRFERRGRALDFGRPPEHNLRDIMDAVLYVDRTGVQWHYSR